jgi:hypothetical protein
MAKAAALAFSQTPYLNYETQCVPAFGRLGGKVAGVNHVTQCSTRHRMARQRRENYRRRVPPTSDIDDAVDDQNL